MMLVALCFGGVGLHFLGLMRHDYDEGQYIALAQAIGAGEVPLRDFFYHQTAYFLYLLSWLPEPHSENLWLYRLPALAGSCLTGVVLYWIARDGLKLRFAILAPVFFYGSLLLDPGLQALPHGLMIFCTALGIYLIFVRGERQHVVWGAVVMATGVCLKPLAIAPVIASALALGLLPRYRTHWFTYCLTIAAVGTLGFLGMHLLTDGGFTHALTLQFSRTSAQSGVQIMKTLPGLSADMEALGDVSSVLFNVAIHGIALTRLPLSFPGDYLFANSTLHVVLLGLGGLWALGRNRKDSPWFVVLGLWWAFAFGFICFVWSPSWQDYLIQYISPMALLAAVCLDRFLQGETLRSLRVVLVIALVAIAVTVKAAAWDRGMKMEADEVHKIQSQSIGEMSWVTFDPYLRFKTDRTEACGLRDPLTAFGLPTDLPGLEVFESQRLTMADVLKCLETAEPTGIWVDDESLMYIDESFARYLLCQDRHLVVYHQPHHARRLRERVGLKFISGKLCEEHW